MTASAQVLGGAQAELAWLCYRSGLAHFCNRNVAQALGSFERAILFYEAQANTHGLAMATMWHIRLRCLHGLVPYGVLPSGVEILQTIVSGLSDGDTDLRGQLMEALSQAYYHARQMEAAHDWANQALDLGHRDQDDRLCMRAGEALGKSYLGNLHVNLAINRWESALEAARESGDLFLQRQNLLNLPLAFNLNGDLESAEATAVQGVEICRRMQDWAGYSIALSQIASILAAQGKFHLVEECAQHTRLMVEQSGYPWGRIRALEALAYTYAVQGKSPQAEEALDLIVEPPEVFPPAGPVEHLLVRVMRQLIRAYQSQSLTERIATLSQELMEVVKHDPRSLAPLCAVIELAQQTLMPSLTDWPAAMLADAVERGVCLTSGWCFVIDRTLGVAARMQKNWGEASTHFVRAIEVARKVGAEPELGRAYLDLAILLVERDGYRGDPLVLNLLNHAGVYLQALRMEPFAAVVRQMKNEHSAV